MLKVDGHRKRNARYTSWARTVRQSRQLLGRSLTVRDFVREWRGTIELAQLYNLGACYGLSERAIEDELYRLDDAFEDVILATAVEASMTI